MFTVKYAFMYDVYGIVKVEIYGCYKGEHFVFESGIIPSIPPKHVKTRKPKDEHCVSQCTWYN